jgi:hypothetical protein
VVPFALNTFLNLRGQQLEFASGALIGSSIFKILVVILILWKVFQKILISFQFNSNQKARWIFSELLDVTA